MPASINRLWSGTVIVMICLAIFAFIYTHNIESKNKMDLNNDGKIDDHELKIFIQHEIDKRLSKPPEIMSLFRSSLTGITRGAMTGLIINGVEGAIVTGIAMGIINPIMTALES